MIWSSSGRQIAEPAVSDGGARTEVHATEPFLRDVLRGLGGRPKRLPCKYFYDQRGSELFDRICDLDEYYLTRAELEIIECHGAAMAGRLGSRCLLIELGSGMSRKTTALLDRADGLAAYMPVDISREALLESAGRLAERYPGLEVLPVCADFTSPLALPRSRLAAERRVVYFPGSTIGNFTPRRVVGLLTRIRAWIGRRGGLLIGVDLRKDAATLEAAYHDRQGTTAEFNLNLLARINRELGGNFQLDGFRHQARYSAEAGRIEMHLVSQAAQQVDLAGRRFELAPGETICTEYSYKYTLEQFAGLARSAGLESREAWLDRARRFSVQYFTPA